MLQAAYARIKGAAPGATVLGGSLAFNDTAYLRAMLDNGAHGAFDGLAIHPYSHGDGPDTITVPYFSFRAGVTHSQQLLNEYLTDLPIWITEMGWSTDWVSDSVRADYFARAVAMVRAEPRVAAFCAYELHQTDDSAGPTTGLINPDGTPTVSWEAYSRAAAAP
jgi:hypothetical protein